MPGLLNRQSHDTYEMDLMGYKKGQLIPNNKLNIRMVDDMNLACFNNDVRNVLYSSVDLIVRYMTCEVPPPVQ